MTIKIFAASAELATIQNGNKSENPVQDEAIKISGKSAGMCYCNDDFFTKLAVDNESAYSRFDRVAATHHHSIADHAQVEVVIQGASKLLAMILNNQGCYNTSEKSGRYTTMKGETEQEQKLYNKWHKIFFSKLKDAPGVIDEKHADKLANENARYMLNIFSPIVNMCYTCSIARWTYLVQWMEEFISRWEMVEYGEFHNMTLKDDPYTFYCVKLAKEFEEFCYHIRQLGLYIPELLNRKDQSIDIFDNFEDIMPIPNSNKENPYNTLWPVCTNACGFDGVIVARFTASFASFAQLQRHRTSKFIMSVFDGEGNFNFNDFYVPKLIRSMNLSNQWIDDLKSLHEVNVIPTATRMMCKMVTTYDKFELMMLERCCGRAQLETMDVVSSINWNLLFQDGMNEDDTGSWVKYCERRGLGTNGMFTKCMKQKCQEPCLFIKDGLVNRTF